MKYRVQGNTSNAQGGEVSLRCPLCRQNGTFFSYTNVHDFIWFQETPLSPKGRFHQMGGGIRICPKPECQAVIFVVTEQNKIRTSFPPETIDFDASNLPARILGVLEEAIVAYTAGCYRASALMVRRLLEEICDDRSIKGKDLNERLAKIGQGSLIPPELIDAAHELRLLGNDAAHIVSKNYDVIGKAEIEASIDLAKEILKSVYQYSALVEKLRKLKTPKTLGAGS